MFGKKIVDSLLRKIKHGCINVVYPDGESVFYGNGEKTLTITIKTNHALNALLKNMSIGFGEAYMNGEIEIDGDIRNIMRILYDNERAFRKWQFTNFSHLVTRNFKSRQQKNIAHHYDIGNDFYKLWLDKSMTYSCAYFKKKSDSLETAQTNKIDHILKKLQLNNGLSLLDIGSGWGELLIKAAKEYGINGLGITLSEEQLKKSRQKAKDAGVSELINFELMNYQDLPNLNRKFDRVVSVGMFEHVGRKGQAVYLKTVSDILNNGGITLLHNISVPSKYGGTDPFMDKYIFPGGYIPSVRSIVSKLPKYDLRLIDYENLRVHYALTLDEWSKRFEAHKDEVINMFDERFYRMWKFYLEACSGNFWYGHLILSQFVMVKGRNNDLPLTREHIYKNK